METSIENTSGESNKGPSRILIGAAGMLALISASCCVLPIGFSIIGLGGTWLLFLGPFVAYRVPIVLAVGLVLLWAWYRVWKRRACVSHRPSTLSILIATSALFLLAATAPLWEAEATRTMFALWRASRS
jgi:mercuric ion transport protein